MELRWLRGAWTRGLKERRGRRGRDRLGPGAQLPSSPDTSCPCLSGTERAPFPPVSRVRGQGVALPLSGQRLPDLRSEGNEDPRESMRVSV